MSQRPDAAAVVQTLTPFEMPEKEAPTTPPAPAEYTFIGSSGDL